MLLEPCTGGGRQGSGMAAYRFGRVSKERGEHVAHGALTRGAEQRKPFSEQIGNRLRLHLLFISACERVQVVECEGAPGST